MVSVDRQTLREESVACQLEAADILLIHTKQSLWGWLIRHGTHCYWNHALLVCSPRDAEQGYGSISAVDAKTNGAIVMNRVSEYFNRSNKYDVAVKRLEADWFQDDGSTSTLDFRSYICNIALSEVDCRIGSRLMGFVDQIIRQLTVILRFIRRKTRRICTSPSLPWNIRPIQVKAFTCGGFVQWYYYKGVSKLVEERGTGQSWLEEVIFNPRAKKEPTPFELLTATPADLANCDKLSWKYVIKEGVVRKVSSSEEARLLTMPV